MRETQTGQTVVAPAIVELDREGEHIPRCCQSGQNDERQDEECQEPIMSLHVVQQSGSSASLPTQQSQLNASLLALWITCIHTHDAVDAGLGQ